MNSLGEQVLEHLAADFRSARYAESLEAIEFSNRDRLLFTFSYVSHQEAVRPEDVEQWASLIEQAVAQSDRAVEVIYATTDNFHGIEPKLPVLGQKLDQADLKRRVERVNVQVHQRYPDERDLDGHVRWHRRSAMWQVEAERWTLRA